MPFTAAELLERRGYLGASEAAAAVGRCNFFTPLQLYQSKIGEGEPIEETIPMMVGTALEPVTIHLLEKEERIKVTDRQARVVDPSNPWRRATLDGVSSDGGVVQAKASGNYGWWGKEDDAIPEGIIHQTQHEMACSGLKFAWVPVILGQREFRVYRIQRDDEHIALLTEQESAFMKRVAHLDPPPPINHEDLKILYPTDHGIELVASIEIENAAHDLAEVKAHLKEQQKVHDDLAFTVKNFMENAAVLKDSRGQVLYTYKSHAASTIDVKRLREEKPAIASAYTREAVVRTLLNKIK